MLFYVARGAQRAPLNLLLRTFILYCDVAIIFEWGWGYTIHNLRPYNPQSLHHGFFFLRICKETVYAQRSHHIPIPQ